MKKILIITSAILFLAAACNQQAAVQPAPAPSPAPTPTADPTANWQTYTSSDLGFQIKYPLNYSITASSSADGSNAGRFLDINNGTQKIGWITIDSKSKFAGMSLSDFAKNAVTPKNIVKSQVETTIQVNGLEVIKQQVTFTQQDAKVKDSTIYYFANSTQYATVAFYQPGDSSIEGQMIASFKFTK